MLPLATAFMFTDGRGEFQLARVQSIISAGSIVDGNVFRLRGEFWQLSFDGKTAFLKDSVGMGYIERVAKSHESLGRHLYAAIDSGLTFRYAPERNPDWLT